MSEIRIRRPHVLGLAAAREAADRWMQEGRSRYHLHCVRDPGESCDIIRFKGPGASGSLRVAADAFELELKLGFLLSAFSPRIEQEIHRNLDSLLGAAPA